MATLEDVFRVLNELSSAQVIEHYAIGGATAVLFYAEPARTYNELVGEAVQAARDFAYGATPVRVVSPEHLVALALQAGGSRRRERAAQLLEADAVDRSVLRGILQRHGLDDGGLLDG